MQPEFSGIERELGGLPAAFAARLALIAELRNVLVHDEVAIDWDQTHLFLHNLYDLDEFARLARGWLEHRSETQARLVFLVASAP